MWWMEGNRVTDHNHTGDEAPRAGADDGQIESEGTHIPPWPQPARQEMHPASQHRALAGDDAGTVNAVQVAMERSGAEHIEAQRVTLDHSGAKSLSTQLAELTDSGAVKLSATTATMTKSSVMLAQAKELRLEESKALITQSGKTEISGTGRVGILQTGSVEASGDVNGILLMTGSVKAGGDVNVTFDAASAGALGAAFAATLFILRRLFRRTAG
jgi:hypothetical protein